jgi:hypothetical protein
VEPVLPAKSDKEHLTSEPKVWHFSYPDGSKNAETLLVHPQTRRIYLVSKSEDGHCALYAAPAVLTEGSSMKLEHIMDLYFPAREHLGKRPRDASETVAGAWSPNGQRIAIATYSFIYEWRVSGSDSLAKALSKQPTVMEPPLSKQMESLCYDRDNLTLWFTSEQLPTPLYKLTR